MNRLIDKFVKTGTTDCAQGSGRPRSRTGYVDEVEDLIASQEDQPGTHLSQRKIAQNSENCTKYCKERHKVQALQKNMHKQKDSKSKRKEKNTVPQAARQVLNRGGKTNCF